VTPAVLRQATIADVAAMHRVRLSVHENRLVFLGHLRKRLSCSILKSLVAAGWLRSRRYCTFDRWKRVGALRPS